MQCGSSGSGSFRQSWRLDAGASPSRPRRRQGCGVTTAAIVLSLASRISQRGAFGMRIAAITGAASGIGQAASRRLLGAGWTVYGLDVARERLDAVGRDFAAWQDRFRPMQCDVADAGSVASTFARIGEAAPALNALVCCAGVLRTGLMEDMSIADFDLVLNVNLRGTFLCAQQALPLLRRAASPDNPSRVVLLSSLAAIRPKIVSGAYAASK